VNEIMTNRITLLLFIGLAWGQVRILDDSNFENQVALKNNDNRSFFSDVSFSIHYARFQKPDFQSIHPINPSKHKQPYSYGFSFIKPYHKYSIELGLGSIKSNERYSFFSYFDSINSELLFKYISFYIYKDYSPSFLNFSIFNETRRYAAISIGFGANIYFDKNIRNIHEKQRVDEYGQIQWDPVSKSYISNMEYLNHQIKGSIGLNIPLHNYVSVTISGKISNVIFPDFIDDRGPIIDTLTEFKRFNKFLLNEMKLNRSIQFELIFHLFGTQNKKTKIIKKKRKKDSKKTKISKGFEDF
jgi:hypothetical protein